jgi:hypothetical protein
MAFPRRRRREDIGAEKTARGYVQLEGEGPSPKVQRLWPDLPRFRVPSGAGDVPELDEDLRAGAEGLVAAANDSISMRVGFEADRVRLELDDDAFAYGPSATLEAFDPSYVELPAELDVAFVRLADDAARRYLGTRTEMTSRDIGLTIIDDARRFYFVVARRLAFTKHGGR